MEAHQRSESPDNKKPPTIKSAVLIEKADPLPKRFFIVAQEGISMLWLDDAPKGSTPHRRNNK